MAIENLYVTYDDEGNTHYHIDNKEVDEATFMLRHPMMKEDKGNGRNRDSGQFGRSESAQSAAESDFKSQRGEALRAIRDRQRAERQAQQDTGGDNEDGKPQGADAQ